MIKSKIVEAQVLILIQVPIIVLQRENKAEKRAKRNLNYMKWMSKMDRKILVTPHSKMGLNH